MTLMEKQLLLMCCGYCLGHFSSQVVSLVSKFVQKG